MYAVIRTGGKQYRVAPGDVVKIEKVPAGKESAIEFSDVLGVSGTTSSENDALASASSLRVLGTVMGEGRGNKILVFHYKRKKQYKKLQGHRQDFTQVRIDSIEVDGNSYTAQK